MERDDYSQELFQRLDKKSINWSINFNEIINLNQNQVIQVLKGTEFQLFDKESQHTLFEKPYIVTLQSDRMGYRLEGPPSHFQKVLSCCPKALHLEQFKFRQVDNQSFLWQIDRLLVVILK